MKNFPTKANLSGGDDSGTATKFGAKEFNSIADELELAVTATGQTLTTGTGDDPSPDQLAKALTITSQTANTYQDSGSANAYVLTKIGSLEQPGSYVDGTLVVFKTSNANTGASTANMSSLGVKKILNFDGSTLSANDIVDDDYNILLYDSNADIGSGAFILISKPRFSQSFTANGYTIFPNGLILQWGFSTATPAGSTVTFPIAFPNQALGFSAVDNQNTVYSYGIDTVTTTNFVFYTSSGSPDGAYWIAIGY